MVVHGCQLNNIICMLGIATLLPNNTVQYIFDNYKESGQQNTVIT